MVLELGGFDGAEGLGSIADIQAMEGLKNPAIPQLEFAGYMAAKHHLKVYDVRHPDTDGGAWFVGSYCCFHVWFVVV